MQKRFSGGTKEWLLIAAGAVLLLAALFLPLKFALADTLTAEEERLLNAWQNGEIIRIHVIANSDSPQDQTVKLKVRDTLIEAFGHLLAQAGEKSSDAVYHLLEENIGQMEQTARYCAQANGFEGQVQAECGMLPLPAKQYGRIVLPEGEYRALRIILGDGKGQNWWCVLYPQLCLALAETQNTETGGVFFFQSNRIWQNWLLLSQ